MKYLFFITALIIVLFSCSKEENVPFIAAEEDTIPVFFYHNIAGKYSGSIFDIEFISDSSYAVLGSAAHSVEVTEIDFETVSIKDISNKVQSDANAEMFRLNGDGGYLRFIGSSMADSMGIDSVYQNLVAGRVQKFNGLYYYNSKRLQYFFYYIENRDTMHQVFEGQIR